MNGEIEVGEKAPDFTLNSTDLKPRKLSDFLTQTVVLAFFPGAFTSVCTKEMCTFRDEWNQISKLGAQVIGISNDGPFANKAFAEAQHLNFPVLGDYKSQTIRDYDILMPDLLHVKGYDAAKRSVFIVDSNGTIVYKWVSDNPLIEPNYQEIIDFLKKGN